MRPIAFLILFFAAFSAIAAPTARGAAYVFTGALNNDWGNAQNWKTACTGGNNGFVPTAADDASICAGATAQVLNTSAVCRTLFVSSGAAVEIIPQSGSAATLTVGNTTNSPPLEDFIFGSVTLKPPSGSNHATLAFVAAPHLVYGGVQPPFMLGEIKGQDDDAAVTIDTDLILTSYLLLIHGNMQIKGGGSFSNEGTVQADANGTLAVKVDFELDDTAGENRWKATSPPSGNSRLLFTGNLVTFGALSGDFVCGSSAKIQIDELPYIGTLSTTGRLTMSAGSMFEALDNMDFGGASGVLNMTGGQIVVGAGKTLTHE